MIGKAIYYLLRTNSALDGVQVSPLVTGQELAMPAITYAIDGVQPSDTKTKVSYLDEVMFTLFIFDKDYANVDAHTYACRSTLDRVCGVYEGVSIQSIQFNSYSDNYDRGADMYGRMITFTARMNPNYSSQDYSPLDYSPLDYAI